MSLSGLRRGLCGESVFVCVRNSDGQRLALSEWHVMEYDRSATQITAANGLIEMTAEWKREKKSKLFWTPPEIHIPHTLEKLGRLVMRCE